MTPKPPAKRINLSTSKKASEQRRALFVDAYLAKGENATQAYMEVYGAKNLNVAGVKAHYLLRNGKVQEAIEKRRAQIRAKFGLTTERIYHEIGRVAYFNPKRLVDENGHGIPLHQLDDDTAAALSAIEITETLEDGTIREVRVKPHNKVAALEQASKILKLYDKPPPLPIVDDGEPVDYRETVRRIAFELRREEALQEKEARIAKPPVKHRKIKMAG